jgi:hypothetical protein
VRSPRTVPWFELGVHGEDGLVHVPTHSALGAMGLTVSNLDDVAMFAEGAGQHGG